MLPPSPTIHPYSQEAATLIQLYKATKLGCFFQIGYNGLSIQLDHAHLQQELPVVLLQSPDYDLLGQHALWYPAQTSMEYNQLKVLIISPGLHQASKLSFYFRASRTL